jgi:hypothetical protein
VLQVLSCTCEKTADRNGAVNRPILATFLFESATNDITPTNRGFDTGKAKGKSNPAFQGIAYANDAE